MSLEPWFAVSVKSRYEFRAAGQLAAGGFEPFLPVRRVRRRWSDRFQTIEEALFPGYLFCRFDLLQRARVLKVPHVTNIVGIGKTPQPVSEEEIDSVRILVSSEVALSPWPYLQAGQAVRIAHGPLAGITGLVLRTNGQMRVVVSVTLLQRSVAAEIDRDWIALAS